MIGGGILIVIIVAGLLWYGLSRRKENTAPSFTTSITDQERAEIMNELSGDSQVTEKERTEALASVEGESTVTAEERSATLKELGSPQ